MAGSRSDWKASAAPIFTLCGRSAVEIASKHISALAARCTRMTPSKLHLALPLLIMGRALLAFLAARDAIARRPCALRRVLLGAALGAKRFARSSLRRPRVGMAPSTRRTAARAGCAGDRGFRDRVGLRRIRRMAPVLRAGALCIAHRRHARRRRCRARDLARRLDRVKSKNHQATDKHR